MKKGFTLVELLAVIVILSILSLIVFPAIYKMIVSSKEASYQEQVKYIKVAGNNWLVQNSIRLSKEHKNCISLEELKNEEFLKKGDIIDPRDNSIMNGYLIFTFDIDYNQYIINYSETCE